MRRFIARVELFWNKNPYLAFGLLIAGAGAAIWTHLHPQSPGYAIGLLALAAGIMSVRPQMQFLEKLAWVAILVTFTYQEMKAIKQNDIENKAVRTSENDAFGHIVSDLKISIQNSKEQYSQTVQHVDSVAATMQRVADLAKINLENVTGGNSYAYVFPTNVSNTGLQLLNIENTGSQILSGVNVEIARVNGHYDPQDCNTNYTTLSSFTTQTLPPHVIRRISQEHYLTPVFNQEGRATFFIGINPQNAGVSETLEFRHSLIGKGVDYKLTVTSINPPDKRKDDLVSCGLRVRFLKRTDWIGSGNQPSK
jgi:hypothetical protein